MSINALFIYQRDRETGNALAARAIELARSRFRMSITPTVAGLIRRAVSIVGGNLDVRHAAPSSDRSRLVTADRTRDGRIAVRLYISTCVHSGNGRWPANRDDNLTVEQMNAKERKRQKDREYRFRRFFAKGSK